MIIIMIIIITPIYISCSSLRVSRAFLQSFFEMPKVEQWGPLHDVPFVVYELIKTATVEDTGNCFLTLTGCSINWPTLASFLWISSSFEVLIFFFSLDRMRLLHPKRIWVVSLLQGTQVFSNLSTCRVTLTQGLAANSGEQKPGGCWHRTFAALWGAEQILYTAIYKV